MNICQKVAAFTLLCKIPISLIIHEIYDTESLYCSEQILLWRNRLMTLSHVVGSHFWFEMYLNKVIITPLLIDCFTVSCGSSNAVFS